jgi:predicted acyltransferase
MPAENFLMSTPNAPTSGRLLSLDVFRGLTILGMILVNNPGDWGSIYWPLEHAPWFGWTPTDLVFPFFLFIVGTSLAYSLRRFVHGAAVDSAVYWRIARRTIVIILLGVGLEVSYRVFSYLFGNADSVSLSNLRYPGVLFRIAVVYCAVSLIVLHCGVRMQIVLAAVLLLGYWALLGWLPNPHDYQANLSPEGNLVGTVDRAVIGANHMYTFDAGTNTLHEQTDPEGLLSTLPAVVTALMGYWAGLAIQRGGANGRTVAKLAAVGLVCFLIGLAWGLWFPISKKLWTSSFVLTSGGLAMIALAGCLLKFDVWGWRRLARPFEIVGVNAIFVYVASGLAAQLLGAIPVGGDSLHGWIYSHLFTSWIAEPKLASLGFALATVAVWWLILWAMSRRGWSIRV